MTPSARNRRGGRSTPPIVRHAYVAILALWVVMPLALSGRVAQDAVPYLSAGHLARSHPSEVYAARNGDLFDLSPLFRHTWCGVAPTGTDCDDVAVAFVASPPIIPLAVALTVFGDRGGALVMQFGAAAMLATGMWVLWRRLAHRTRHAPQLLLASVVLLTPMAMGPIGLGQTSPILFLSVCLGLGITSRRRSVASAIAWTAATALKIFPAVLVTVLVWRKRWQSIAWAAAILGVLSLVCLATVVPAVWGDFVDVTLALDGHVTTNPYNGAVGAFFVRLLGSPDSAVVTLAARGLALGLGAAVCWFGMRGTDDDTRWAAGYVALLIITPLVWWHYTWVLVGALGVVLAAQRHLDDRVLAVLPVAALVSVVPSIPNANGHSWPEIQAVLLLVGTATFCVLARRTTTPARNVPPANGRGTAARRGGAAARRQSEVL